MYRLRSVLNIGYLKVTWERPGLSTYFEYIIRKTEMRFTKFCYFELDLGLYGIVVLAYYLSLSRYFRRVVALSAANVPTKYPIELEEQNNHETETVKNNNKNINWNKQLKSYVTTIVTAIIKRHKYITTLI